MEMKKMTKAVFVSALLAAGCRALALDAAAEDGASAVKPALMDESARTYECGMMEGLIPSAEALAAVIEGEGDVYQRITRLEIRRDMGNSTAKALSAAAKTVRVPFMGLALEEIGRDLRGAPQEGYGDADYWSRLIKEQDDVFRRAGERLRALRNAVCANQGPK